MGKIPQIQPTVEDCEALENHIIKEKPETKCIPWELQKCQTKMAEKLWYLKPGLEAETNKGEQPP